MIGKHLLMRFLSLAMVCAIYALPHTALAVDAPHNVINCDECHALHQATYPTLLKSLCESCHYTSGPAPAVETHSSRTIDNDYGDWDLDCWACHNPHKQDQNNFWGSTYGKFIRKSMRAQIKEINPDPVRPYYEPLSILRTVNTTNTIEFKGTTEFVDGDVSSDDDICQVCHESTSNYTVSTGPNFNVHSDQGGSAQPGANCTACHRHSVGFKPVEISGPTTCFSCHFEPVSATKRTIVRGTNPDPVNVGLDTAENGGEFTGTAGDDTYTITISTGGAPGVAQFTYSSLNHGSGGPTTVTAWATPIAIELGLTIRFTDTTDPADGVLTAGDIWTINVLEDANAENRADFVRPSRHFNDGTANQIVNQDGCLVCHNQDNHTTSGSADTVWLNHPDTGALVTYDGTGGSVEGFCTGCHDDLGAENLGASALQPFFPSSGDPNTPPDIAGPGAADWAASSHSAGLTTDKCMACHGGSDTSNAADVNVHSSTNVSLLSTIVGGETLPLPLATQDLCLACHDSDGPSTFDTETEFTLVAATSNTGDSGALVNGIHDLTDTGDTGCTGNCKVTCSNCHEPHKASSSTPVIDPNAPATNFTTTYSPLNTYAGNNYYNATNDYDPVNPVGVLSLGPAVTGSATADPGNSAVPPLDTAVSSGAYTGDDNGTYTLEVTTGGITGVAELTCTSAITGDSCNPSDTYTWINDTLIPIGSYGVGITITDGDAAGYNPSSVGAAVEVVHNGNDTAVSGGTYTGPDDGTYTLEVTTVGASGVAELTCTSAITGDACNPSNTYTWTDDTPITIGSNDVEITITDAPGSPSAIGSAIADGGNTSVPPDLATSNEADPPGTFTGGSDDTYTVTVSQGGTVGAGGFNIGPAVPDGGNGNDGDTWASGGTYGGSSIGTYTLTVTTGGRANQSTIDYTSDILGDTAGNVCSGNCAFSSAHTFGSHGVTVTFTEGGGQGEHTSGDIWTIAITSAGTTPQISYTSTNDGSGGPIDVTAFGTPIDIGNFNVNISFTDGGDGDLTQDDSWTIAATAATAGDGLAPLGDIWTIDVTAETFGNGLVSGDIWTIDVTAGDCWPNCVEPDYVAFCLACHDGSTPPGVEMPTNMVNMVTRYFGNQQHGNVDGQQSSKGPLKPPWTHLPYTGSEDGDYTLTVTTPGGSGTAVLTCTSAITGDACNPSTTYTWNDAPIDIGSNGVKIRVYDVNNDGLASGEAWQILVRVATGGTVATSAKIGPAKCITSCNDDTATSGSITDLDETIEGRDYAAMPCTQCHEQHGSANIFHLKESITIAGVELLTGATDLDNVTQKAGVFDIVDDPVLNSRQTRGSTTYILPEVAGQQEFLTWGAWCTFCHTMESHTTRYEAQACQSGHTHGSSAM